MAKIDKIKEILNTLRVLLSLSVGLILGLSAKISDLYDKSIFDIRFYLSILSVNILIVVILYIAVKIRHNTNKIEEEWWMNYYLLGQLSFL